MIANDAPNTSKEKLQEVLLEFPQVFQGLSKLKNHQVKLHLKSDARPVRASPRRLPYHLQDRAESAVQTMIQDGVLEEHPIDEPCLWKANVVVEVKDDGNLRV